MHLDEFHEKMLSCPNNVVLGVLSASFTHYGSAGVRLPSCEADATISAKHAFQGRNRIKVFVNLFEHSHCRTEKEVIRWYVYNYHCIFFNYTFLSFLFKMYVYFSLLKPFSILLFSTGYLFTKELMWRNE